MAQGGESEFPQLRPGTGRLQGKVAVITGANSGIGRATACLFGREGARVVCCDIQETIEPRIDKLIQREGGEAVFARIDVTRQNDCDQMAALALEAFGDIDILFNNAGGSVRKKLHDLSDDEWNFVMDLNLNSIFRGARAVLPHFLKKQSGNIVNTSSSFGIIAAPDNAAYCTTKAAIINLTHSLALDYGRFGIRVNCVCPGAIETPRFRGFPPKPMGGAMTPETKTRLANTNKALLRLGQPEEVAYGVLFLASDEASFITGHALVIDGGQTVSL